MNLTGQRVKSPQRTYDVGPLIREGETYDVHLATIEGDTKDRSVIVKVVADVVANPFADHEAKALTYLNEQIRDASRGIKLFIPELLEHFELDHHAVVVTDYAVDYFSIEQIRSQYPDGVPPRAVAWMINRMLEALILTDAFHVVHGGFIPTNVLFHSGKSWKTDPIAHAMTPVDWTRSIRRNDDNSWPCIGAISKDYEAFYPPEVKRRKPASPQTDLAMMAGCAIYLLGGDVETSDAYDKVGEARGMADLLRACRAPNPDHRSQNFIAFHEQFQRTLFACFGEPTFVELPLSASR